MDKFEGVYFVNSFSYLKNNSLLTIHPRSHLLDLVAGDVFIIFHHLVDDAIRGELDDAVGHGLDEFVVVTAEEHIALVELQVVVECLDALEVEMVGGCVEDEAVGILQLHAGNHTTHLLASGEDIGLLQHLLATEEHTAEETLEVYFVAFAKLAEPIDEVEIGVEELGIVEG